MVGMEMDEQQIQNNANIQGYREKCTQRTFNIFVIFYSDGYKSIFYNILFG